MGKPATGPKPGKTKLRKLYIKESKSVRDIAVILGCSKDMVYRALRDYGIERRPHTWGPRLQRYNLEFLRDMVNKKGYRNGAKELGVDKSTLFRYLNRMKKID